MLCALRRHYPRSYIAWATQPAAASLIRNHTDLDEVIEVERGWFRSIAGIRDLRLRLLEGRFDVAVDPQGLTKSAVIGWLAGAPHRIGFTRGQSREVSPWLNNRKIAPQCEHVVDKYLELLAPLWIRQPAVRFKLPIDAMAKATVRQFTRQADLKSFAVLNPGAGWDSKLWPHNYYAVVARHLWQAHQLPSVVVWSGPREQQWATEIVSAAGQGSVLAADTTLPELAALLCEAGLFVGSDTGPLHLAAAVGTPCVGMYGPTRPAECGPYGQNHITLQAFYQDGKGSDRRGNDNRAMRAITPDGVCRACDQLLSRRASLDPNRDVA